MKLVVASGLKVSRGLKLPRRYYCIWQLSRRPDLKQLRFAPSRRSHALRVCAYHFLLLRKKSEWCRILRYPPSYCFGVPRGEGETDFRFEVLVAVWGILCGNVAQL